MGLKGKELSLEQKSRITALFDTGYKKKDIVRLTGVKQSTVYSHAKNKMIWKISEDRGGEQFTDRDSRFQCLFASKISLCFPAGQSVGKVAPLYSCLTGK